MELNKFRMFCWRLFDEWLREEKSEYKMQVLLRPVMKFSIIVNQTRSLPDDRVKRHEYLAHVWTYCDGKLFVTTRNTLASAVGWQYLSWTQMVDQWRGSKGVFPHPIREFELAYWNELPRNCLADSFVWGLL